MSDQPLNPDSSCAPSARGGLIRVIHDIAHDGPTNMARDEALMTLVGRGESIPTLRTYAWSPPTVSLGYFQKFADFAALEPPAGELDVVRRLTGGGAILHDREVTYSITLPLGHPLLAGGPNCLYQRAHDALIALLDSVGVHVHREGESDGFGASRGPFFCFARRHRLDVLHGADKLAGSAQRRTQKAVLQHGSIILERRFTQQPAAAITALAPIPPSEVARRFADSLISRADLQAVPGDWTAQELELADTLIAKYTGEDWTRRS